VAAFARLVDETAESGDAVATEILKGAAASLLTLTEVVRRRLFAPAEAVKVAYVGGVFQSSAVLRDFRSGVERDPNTTVIEPLHGPAMGALLEARRLAQ
jgi:N-acetylglucosamine kinase-like BadF-type ATPase